MKKLLIAAAAFICPALAEGEDSPVRAEAAAFQEYQRTVEQTVGMAHDAEVRRFAKLHGLDVLNLTWEDTGRTKNSALRPNISDMTIQVQTMDPRTEKFALHCMPVLRFPNFADLSCDVDANRFYVLTGNEKGAPLHKVALAEMLGDLRKYLSRPDSWKGEKRSLMSERDTHVLVSAQACFLPIPARGSAEFNPVLFNYQSSAGNPAVLTVLATREGTSVTVIDNQRDRFHAGRTWGQRLFFNQNGQRASLTGKRLSEFSATKDDSTNQARPSEPGLNLVLLVQVPLKHKPIFPEFAMFGGAAPAPAGAARSRGVKRDVEDAVVGHGKVEGPFTEIADLPIERDPQFPIRVTVQFYKATSNGVASSEDVEAIAAQIRRVYKDADYVGSLVTEGCTGRPTESARPPLRR